MKNKGFTLIELLAVIVILGVLMMSAIPAVTTAISRSRRNTFASNARQVVNSARNSLSSAEFIQTTGNKKCQFPPRQKTTKIELDSTTLDLLLEKGAAASSFDVPYEKGAIFVYNSATSDKTSDHYQYYIVLFDEGGNGITKPTYEENISGDIVATAVDDAELTKARAFTGDTGTLKKGNLENATDPSSTVAIETKFKCKLIN